MARQCMCPCRFGGNDNPGRIRQYHDQNNRKEPNQSHGRSPNKNQRHCKRSKSSAMAFAEILLSGHNRLISFRYNLIYTAMRYVSDRNDGKRFQSFRVNDYMNFEYLVSQRRLAAAAFMMKFSEPIQPRPSGGIAARFCHSRSALCPQRVVNTAFHLSSIQLPSANGR